MKMLILIATFAVIAVIASACVPTTVPRAPTSGGETASLASGGAREGGPPASGAIAAAQAASGGAPAAATTATAPAFAASPRPIGYAALKASLDLPGTSVLLLDVRTKEEYASGHIPGAILAPYDALQGSFAEPEKKRHIVVYCRSGRRSAIAAETLARMGYSDVSDFGGIDNWKGPLER